MFGDELDKEIFNRALILAKDMISKPNDLKELNNTGIKYSSILWTGRLDSALGLIRRSIITCETCWYGESGSEKFK